MNKHEIFAAINNIDDAYITEAYTARKQPRFLQKKLLASAACLALCAAALLSVFTLREKQFHLKPAALAQAPLNSSLPKITARQESGGMGFEGYLIKSVSDLDSNNPWTPEMQLDTLPVYENKRLVPNAEQRLIIESDESIIARAEKTWNDFNAGDYAVTIERSPSAVPESEMDSFLKAYIEKGRVLTPEIFGITYVELKNDKLTVRADSASSDVYAEMKLKNTFLLNFLFSDAQYYSKLLKYAGSEYIKFQYNYLLSGYKAEITGKTYAFPNESGVSRRMYELGFYKKGISDEEKILNYSFKRKVPYINSSEGFGMWEYNTDLSGKLGDYPTISPEEALTLLYGGGYLTTVPHTITNADKVVKVELVYRSASNEPMYLPYYKFYVNLENDAAIYKQDGFIHVGAYYVPAIEPQYLSGKTIGISFNGAVLTDMG